MDSLRSLLKGLLAQPGQDLTEYGLFLGLIALIAVVAMTVMGENISMIFSNLASQMAEWW